MRSLISADLISVSNKPLFTFKGVEGLDPRDLLGRQVIIDGHSYIVLSVETFAALDPTGMNFGLMVRRAYKT